MPGFSPVGSFPVASVPGGTGGTVYFITPANARFGGNYYTLTYNFLATRVSWIGAEVLHPGVADARVSWIGAEVLHPGVADARVSWIGVEVLRSIEDALTDSGFVSILW